MIHQGTEYETGPFHAEMCVRLTVYGMCSELVYPASIHAVNNIFIHIHLSYRFFITHIYIYI